MGIDKIVSPSKRLVTLRTTNKKNSNAIVEEELKNRNQDQIVVEQENVNQDRIIVEPEKVNPDRIVVEPENVNQDKTVAVLEKPE